MPLHEDFIIHVDACIAFHTVTRTQASNCCSDVPVLLAPPELYSTHAQRHREPLVSCMAAWSGY
jgi:hypothetical protein